MSSQKNRISLFDIEIDVMDRTQAVEACRRLIANSVQSCRYVVTPNVDHVLMLQENELFRSSYAGAELVLADGNPIVWASRLLNKPLPGTVTGSDLVPSVMRAFNDAQEKLSVFLLGAGPGVAETAAEAIKNELPNVKVTGCYSPPFGFEKDPAASDKIVELVNAAHPQLLVIGLGAPKQEIWIHNNAGRLNAKLAICAGAVIDFMAGEKPRAPRWMQKLALEWLHRMLSEPRRLAKRYARGAIIFPRLVFKELRKKSS